MIILAGCLAALSHAPIVAPNLPSADARQDAASKTGKSFFVGGWGGKGQLILGSTDPRVTGGLSFGWGQPDRRLRWGHVPGQFMREFYFQRSHSAGAGEPRNDTTAYGFLPYARWRLPKGRGFGLYADAGFGIQYADRATVDLNSHFNTTPMLGLGTAAHIGDTEILYGLRLLHISNGGTHKPNHGQNQLLLTVFVRF